MTIQKLPDAKFTDTFRFSASSYKSYIQCGRKFKFEKIEKIKVNPDDEVGHARWMGKLVHASVYQSIADFNPEGDFKSWTLREGRPDLSRALKLFRALWEQDYSDPHTKVIYMQKSPLRSQEESSRTRRRLQP
jgi:hypothetical protein